MKFLKGLLITLLVLFVLVFAGAFIFIKNFDINKYRGQITAEISKQVGRTVAIDKLGLNLSLFKGVYAEITGLKISEDPAFRLAPEGGSGDFLSVGAVHVNVDVMAYLTRKEIVVTKVTIDGFNVSVIRDNQGVMNVQKIGPAQTAATSATTQAASAPATPPATLPNFSVQTIAIENGTLLFVDNGQNPPMRIAVSQIDFIVKDFSLQKVFGFEGQAAVIGGEKNISLKGQASVNVAAQEATVNSLEVQFDLAKLAIADLLKAIPQAAPAGLTDKLQGKIVVHIPSLTAGAKGLGELAMKGQFLDGKITTTMLPVALDKITADFSADAKNFTVDSFSTQISTGVISGTAKILDYTKTMGLNANVKANAIPIGSLVTLPEGMKLVGAANAELTVSGQNLANPDAFLNSLNGSGQFDVKDGKIENLNILKMILSRIEFIPGLVGAVEANIPEKYREDFTRDQTIFQKLSSSLQINSGVVNLPDLQVLSTLFGAEMQITADPKLNGKVAGKVFIPADLSAALAAQANALSYLTAGDGRITISLTSFEGPLTSLKIMPDVKELGKVAIQSEGKKQLNKLLGKVLKTEDGSAPAPEGQEGAPSAGEEIIGGVLDKIFK